MSVEFWSVDHRRRIAFITRYGASPLQAQNGSSVPKTRVPAAASLCPAWSLCLTRTLDKFNEVFEYQSNAVGNRTGYNVSVPSRRDHPCHVTSRSGG